MIILALRKKKGKKQFIICDQMQLNILSLVISPQGKGGGGVWGREGENNPRFKVLGLTLEGNILTVRKYP